MALPRLTPPEIASPTDHRSRLGDVDFWAPYVAEVLSRHGLEVGEISAGFNATYPTFLVGEHVVKLFGGSRSWQASHTAERRALAAVAGDAEIAAPRLVADGRLFVGREDSWPYLVTSRLGGEPLWRAELSPQGRAEFASALGRQMRRVHALPAAGVPSAADLRVLKVAAAAAQSSLPAQLVAGVDRYLAGLGPIERVLVHGDLVANHLYVADGELTGIIDWGDATLTDRHYDLCQLHLDAFAGDKTLLRLFLEASDWPVREDFPHRALGLALIRQATGLAQHQTMDVFEPLPALVALDELTSLEELADALFAL